MDNRELACKIAKKLFTNGSGQHAQRLVLELPGLKDGGGWCEAAVADVIEDHLNAAEHDWICEACGMTYLEHQVGEHDHLFKGSLE